MNKLHVLIPCAGSGNRFGSTLPKQYHQLAGKTVLDWTLITFIENKKFASICVVYSANDSYMHDYFKKYPQVTFIPLGGVSRAESVSNGLSALYADSNDWVLVHDAARCCLTNFDLEQLINQVQQKNVGGILAQIATDTVKLVDLQMMVVNKTLNRNQIYLAQTPQMFKFSELKQALLKADKQFITDEASAMEIAGHEVQIIPAKYPNFKVTYQQDLELAELLLLKRSKGDSNV